MGECQQFPLKNDPWKSPLPPTPLRTLPPLSPPTISSPPLPHRTIPICIKWTEVKEKIEGSHVFLWRPSIKNNAITGNNTKINLIPFVRRAAASASPVKNCMKNSWCFVSALSCSIFKVKEWDPVTHSQMPLMTMNSFFSNTYVVNKDKMCWKLPVWLVTASLHEQLWINMEYVEGVPLPQISLWINYCGMTLRHGKKLSTILD